MPGTGIPLNSTVVSANSTSFTALYMASHVAEVLEVLSILADEYENKHFPIEVPDPIEAIKYRVEQLNLSQKDLAKYLGE